MPYLLRHYASLVITDTIKQRDYISNKISVYLTKYNSQSRMLRVLHSWWLNESRQLGSNQETRSLLAASQDLVQVYQTEDTMLQSHWWLDLEPANNAMTSHIRIYQLHSNRAYYIEPWTPAGFFPRVGKFIGIARIFSGVHFSSSKNWRPFVVVTQAKTTKLTTPTHQLFPAQQKNGVLTKNGENNA